MIIYVVSEQPTKFYVPEDITPFAALSAKAGSPFMVDTQCEIPGHYTLPNLSRLYIVKQEGLVQIHRIEPPPLESTPNWFSSRMTMNQEEWYPTPLAATPYKAKDAMLGIRAYVYNNIIFSDVLYRAHRLWRIYGPKTTIADLI